VALCDGGKASTRCPEDYAALRAAVLRAVDLRAGDLRAEDFLRGRPRRFAGPAVRAAGDDTTPLRRPGRGFLAPAINSETCVEHRSLTKFPRPTRIVTVSAAGRPHASQTRIVFSAIDFPFSLVGRECTGTVAVSLSAGTRSERTARVSRNDVALRSNARCRNGTASPSNTSLRRPASI
jgi:hypothetical protein